MNIIELAKQAGIPTLLFPDGVEELSAAHERFATLVRNATLEEAAGLADDLAKQSFYSEHWQACVGTAVAIRAMKEKT